jgi:hypothetical protein
MLSRCCDPASPAYARYGGRGIKVSEEFHDKRVFVEYCLTLPDCDKAISDKLEIDRIDNNGNYERGNLRFVSRRTNCENNGKTIHAEFEGELVAVRRWAETHSKFTPGTVVRLVQQGITLKQVLEREHGDNPGFRPRKRRGQS